MEIEEATFSQHSIFIQASEYADKIESQILLVVRYDRKVASSLCEWPVQGRKLERQLREMFI